MNKNIETKLSNFTSQDSYEIVHNQYISLSSTLLATTQGVQDPRTTNTNNRIGDKINLRGVKLKMMVELNERYSDVTFRMLVIKSAKGDVPTNSTLFNGLTANKMLDTLNTERYTILASKYFKMKAPNMVPINPTAGTAEAGSGVQNAGIEYTTYANMQALSRSTKIIKLWLPGKKFVKSGVVTYEDGTSQPKFFDYHVLLYAYSNYTTGEYTIPGTGWFVGRVNDFISQMYFKDA